MLFTPIYMNKTKVLLIISATIIIMLSAVLIGTVNITAKDIIDIILHKLFDFPLKQGLKPNTVSIIWTLRLPRVFLAFLVGAALSASGTVIQSILKNPLASPYTLGVSSGASLSAGLIIVFGISIPFLGNLTLPLIGFISGLITVFTAIAFSRKVDEGLSSNTIILVGMVFSLFVNAALTILTALYRENIESIVLWQMGSFSLKGWNYVKAASIFFVIGIAGVMKYSNEMDLLSFGEDEAKSNGVETEKVKKKLLIFSSILTGSSVALSGTIGFVDLIAPHVARKFFGSKHIYVLPMSAVFGGALMIFSDIIARTIISPSELPVGAVTALIGAPFFAYIYFKKAGDLHA